MKIKGCNNMKIHHLQKQRLDREDRPPLRIACEASLLAEAIISLPANYKMQFSLCKVKYVLNAYVS
jgi:hypothetical protein